MLDLCSGFGGASEAMKCNGWRVVRVDIEPRVNPDVVADIQHFPLAVQGVDLLWCSPPCTYYSRWHKRHCLYPGEPPPDLSLWHASEEIIERINPRYWVIENVQGAIDFHGRPSFVFGPYHLWTNIPTMLQPVWKQRRKKNLCWGSDPLRGAKRGYIPYAISDAVRLSIESLEATT